MLYFKANFQIPNSGVQAAEVYAVYSDNLVKFYSDQTLVNLLFTKEYTIPNNVDPYIYLSKLEEFSAYSIV